MLLYKAEIRKFASRRMLYYFIPITIISTPLGQITGDRVSTELVEMIGGILVTFVAVFEVYQKRDRFASWLCGWLKKKKDSDAMPRLDSQQRTEQWELGSSDDSSIPKPFSEHYELGDKVSCFQFIEDLLSLLLYRSHYSLYIYSTVG